MCKKRKTSVLLGVILSSTVLLCGCLCYDSDEDGYFGHTGLCPDGTDCNDGDADVHPGAEEICGNEVDEDCDGSAEQEDDDNDGYHDILCEGDDCDDTRADVHPGQIEGPTGDPTCSDGLDNDCDGQMDEEDSACVSIPGMVPLPWRCFNMGDSFGEGSGNELPVHEVCIYPFWIDAHEVTNAAYKECVDAGVCSAPSQSISRIISWLMWRCWTGIMNGSLTPSIASMFAL